MQININSEVYNEVKNRYLEMYSNSKDHAQRFALSCFIDSFEFDDFESQKFYEEYIFHFKKFYNELCSYNIIE